MAQTLTVSGTVSDADGLPLPGANVIVDGTQRGTVTLPDGTFSLEVNATDKQLLVSFVGYQSKVVPLDGRQKFNVKLAGVIGIEEVVVTALGVMRSEKSLGYAIQKLDGQKLTEVPATNVVNGLNGKLAGVNIQGGAAGPTASANITIRGENSLSGDNQALFVVNGIPITNGLFSPGDGLNGSTTIDFGNAAQIINPDDIAEISVLKGPAAAALYGTRAANGVILVTMRTGQGAKGWGVTLNSTTTFSSILKLPDYQNEYGVGGYGRYSYNVGTTYTGDYYDAFGENWGPRMDGTPIVQWNSNGEAVPFTAAPDNIRNFFQTGIITLFATISVVTGLKKGVKLLSEINIWLAIGLMLLVLLVGPTVKILDVFVQSTGNYAQNLISLGTWTEAFRRDGEWQHDWTVFYWAWWIAWSPFVGIFIARISKGRTVRQFLLNVLIVPVLFTFFWFSVFGTSALELELAGVTAVGEAIQADLSTALFVMLEQYPLAIITSVVGIVLVTSFFVTSSDSGSLVVDMLTSGGALDAPVGQRIFWALTEGAVAAALLVGGGLKAMQSMSIAAGIPYAFLVLVMIFSIRKGLHADWLALPESKKPMGPKPPKAQRPKRKKRKR